jgi:hypothetical protein
MLPEGAWRGPVDAAVRDVLDCVCEQLSDRCPCAVHTSFGESPAYRCCGDCKGEVGQLTAWVVTVYPTMGGDRLEPMREVIKGCAPPTGIAVQVAVKLNRCHPTIQKGGKPPTIEHLDAAAAQGHLDLFEMTQALACCLPERRDGKVLFHNVTPTDIGQFVTTATIGSAFAGCSSMVGSITTRLIASDYEGRGS